MLGDAMPDALMRHVRAVRNVRLPGGRVPFRLGDVQVGWLAPDAAAHLAGQAGCRRVGDGVALERAAALPALAHGLAEAGWFAWRGEAFDVRARPGGEVLATVDRGALPWFGIAAEGVHVNGLVRRADGLHIWIARRAADRLIDPGKLDHLFAGGISAGMTPETTLVKEGAEEAGLAPDVVRAARPVGVIAYTMQRPEGLRRDRLHCYDLALAEAVVPVPADGEVAGFELWPASRVLAALRETDDFKFNVTLVLIDLFLRLGVLAGDEAENARLAEALRAGEGR
jgi:8-oxo-dGTP pyrophosphatase MutT (NUDIX family)